MNIFLYGRLKARDQGYDFYISPMETIGRFMRDAVSSDLINDESRLVFLQSQRGIIAFGVREQLAEPDDFGRVRSNFLGFQLEADERPNDLPFFDALSQKFDAITAEANACHDRLDADPRCGNSLRETNIRFGSGNYQQGNAWDEAVMKIRRTPSADLLMMFDERGSSLPLTIKPASAEKTLRDPAASGERVGTHPVPTIPAAHLGIRTTVELREHERTYVPPLPEPSKKKRGFLRHAWGGAVKSIMVPAQWLAKKLSGGASPHKEDSPEP